MQWLGCNKILVGTLFWPTLKLTPMPNYSNIFRAGYDRNLSSFLQNIFDPEPENPCTIYIELAYSSTVKKVTFYIWRNDTWCLNHPADCPGAWLALNSVNVKIGGMIITIQYFQQLLMIRTFRRYF